MACSIETVRRRDTKTFPLKVLSPDTPYQKLPICGSFKLYHDHGYERPATANLRTRTLTLNHLELIAAPIATTINKLPDSQMSNPSSYTSTANSASLARAATEVGAHSELNQPTEPPALNRGCAPLPSQTLTGDQAELHSVLEYKIGAPYANWDLTKPLERALEGFGGYLAELATEPPLPSLTVVHPQLPWCITVHRSDFDWVTVGDVLTGIYSAMGMHLAGGEGTRLQLLEGKKLLVGLKKSGFDGDVWEMVVV